MYVEYIEYDTTYEPQGLGGWAVVGINPTMGTKHGTIINCLVSWQALISDISVISRFIKLEPNEIIFQIALIEQTMPLDHFVQAPTPANGWVIGEHMITIMSYAFEAFAYLSGQPLGVAQLDNVLHIGWKTSSIKIIFKKTNSKFLFPFQFALVAAYYLDWIIS